MPFRSFLFFFREVVSELSALYYLYLNNSKSFIMKACISCLVSILIIGFCFTDCRDSKTAKLPGDTIVQTGVNEPFELQLEACLTCGYAWFLEPVDTTKIQLLGETSEPKNRDPELVGGNAIQTWRFIGLQEGDYLLVFNYKRPWEEKIMKTEKIRIVIGQSPSLSATSSVTIVVPDNDSLYKARMTGFVQEGGEDPVLQTTFIKKEVTVPYTTNIMKASAQAAAEDIYPSSVSAGGPGVDSVAYFRIRSDTAFILLGMDIDGWAGVSVAKAIVHPVVERTLLQFPEIKQVVFDSIP